MHRKALPLQGSRRHTVFVVFIPAFEKDGRGASASAWRSIRALSVFQWNQVALLSILAVVAVGEIAVTKIHKRILWGRRDPARGVSGRRCLLQESACSSPGKRLG
jgi:hypothetical protein